MAQRGEYHDLRHWRPIVRKGPTRFVRGLGDVPVYRAEAILRREPDPKDHAEVDIVNGFADRAEFSSLSAIQTSYVMDHPAFGTKVWLATFVWMLWLPEQLQRADKLWADFETRRRADLGRTGWSVRHLHVTHAQTPLPWRPVTIWERRGVLTAEPASEEG